MSDIYLKISGVNGDVTDASYPGHIHVLSLTLGGTNPSSVNVGVRAGSGSGGGKVIMEDVSFMKLLDRSTPTLTTAFFVGNHFEEFEFKYVLSRGESSDVFKTVKLTDVLITGFHHSGKSGGDVPDTEMGGSYKFPVNSPANDLPREKISLNFAKIEMSYRPRRSDGGFENPLKSGYNVATARKI